MPDASGPTFCISDLHVHDTFTDGSLFTKDKEDVFSALVDDIFEEQGELVLAGDILDLTGTVPPRNWLADFFDRAYPGGSLEAAKAGFLPTPIERPVGDRIQAISQAFPTFFRRLGDLMRAGKARFIPGNHDWEMFTPLGVDAFLKAVGGGNLSSSPQYMVKGAAIAAHGNQFDGSNKTDSNFSNQDGWRNPGAVITSVLYHALCPVLTARGVDPIYVSQIPAVRPEDQIVDGLQRLPQFSDTGVLQALLGAFTRLLYENDYPVPAILDFPGIANLLVTPDRLKTALSGDTSVDTTLENQAALAIAGKPSGLSLSDGTPGLVVMGHTHDLDLSRPNYINLGTWIDHVSALGAAPDLTLPLLRIDAGPQAVLYDARDYVRGKRDRPLWRSQAPTPAP